MIAIHRCSELCLVFFRASRVSAHFLQGSHVEKCTTGTNRQRATLRAWQSDGLSTRLTHLASQRACLPAALQTAILIRRGGLRQLSLGMIAELIIRMSAVSGRSPDCGGCVSIKTAAEYRVMATKCFQWARNTCINELRETYLQLAQFWLELASKLDSPPRSKV